MLRRRLMFIKSEEPTPPVDDWDIKWDYTKGLISNNDFDKTVSQNATETLQSDGVLLATPYITGSYIRFTPKNYTTNDNTIMEVVFELKTISALQNGFRLLLSDGSKGVQIYLSNYQGNNKIRYGWGASTWTHQNIILETDVEYKIRLELLKSQDLWNVYFNDELIITGKMANASSSYCTANRIFQQDSNSSTLVKSIKYKFL